MSQGEHRGDGNSVFPCYPDLKLVSHTFEQVPEPPSWLREQLMAPPGTQQKPVELTGKLFSATCLIEKLLPFCPPHLPSEGIIVQSSKNLIQTRTQIQLVKPVRTTRLQIIGP